MWVQAGQGADAGKAGVQAGIVEAPQGRSSHGPQKSVKHVCVCRAHPYLCCNRIINVFELLDQIIDAIYHLHNRESIAWHSMERSESTGE